MGLFGRTQTIEDNGSDPALSTEFRRMKIHDASKRGEFVVVTVQRAVKAIDRRQSYELATTIWSCTNVLYM